MDGRAEAKPGDGFPKGCPSGLELLEAKLISHEQLSVRCRKKVALYFCFPLDIEAISDLRYKIAPWKNSGQGDASWQPFTSLEWYSTEITMDDIVVQYRSERPAAPIETKLKLTRERLGEKTFNSKVFRIYILIHDYISLLYSNSKFRTRLHKIILSHHSIMCERKSKSGPESAFKDGSGFLPKHICLVDDELWRVINLIAFLSSDWAWFDYV